MRDVFQVHLSYLAASQSMVVLSFLDTNGGRVLEEHITRAGNAPSAPTLLLPNTIELLYVLERFEMSSVAQ